MRFKSHIFLNVGEKMKIYDIEEKINGINEKIDIFEVNWSKVNISPTNLVFKNLDIARLLYPRVLIHKGDLEELTYQDHENQICIFSKRICSVCEYGFD